MRSDPHVWSLRRSPEIHEQFCVSSSSALSCLQPPPYFLVSGFISGTLHRKLGLWSAFPKLFLHPEPGKTRTEKVKNLMELYPFFRKHISLKEDEVSSPFEFWLLQAYIAASYGCHDGVV